uniref:Uncharacterized protein n=1 Tax=Salix viminalis TaxID=40686 RepID=A0A6N2NFN3_SALVM
MNIQSTRRSPPSIQNSQIYTLRWVNIVGDERLLGVAPFSGSSAGSAAAVLVKAFRTKNANIGERSSVPPSGGMIPRNMFKYGSHKRPTYVKKKVPPLPSTKMQNADYSYQGWFLPQDLAVMVAVTNATFDLQSRVGYLRGLTMAGGELGNQVKTSLATNRVLYIFKKLRTPLANTNPVIESPGKTAAKL